MTQAAAASFEIPTESPQLARRRAGSSRRVAAAVPPAARRMTGAETRAATRGDGEVIELEHGITVYPPRQEGGRWRAVWQEDGERQQCESVSKDMFTAKLEKARHRLATGAPGLARLGADLIAWYLNPDRLPVTDQWSRKYAYTQRSLCQRFAAPVIGAVTRQDITVVHTQRIVNAAPTAGEGDRVHRMLSALVGAGIKGGYLVNPMLAEVHWQAGDRPLPAQKVTVAGESALLVDATEIPSGADVRNLGRAGGQALGERDELMANLAAYSGLRWGELAALTVQQVDEVVRVITVDRKVVEINGQLYVEAPKNRKYRQTVYPRRTPGGYPLAERLAARAEEAGPSRRPGPARSDWSSRRRPGSTGGPPTSIARLLQRTYPPIRTENLAASDGRLGYARTSDLSLMPTTLTPHAV